MKRNTKGQLAPVLIIIGILAAFLFAAFAIDTNHYHAVKSEMQNAVDAGALAGAHDLWFDLVKAEPDAIAFTGKNIADGKPVVDNPLEGSTVQAHAEKPKVVNGKQVPGWVEVTATRKIRNLAGVLLGRGSDVISVRAVAGTKGELYGIAANQLFPFAVSLDAVATVDGQKYPALKDVAEGGTFTIFLNAKKVQNGCWTSLTVSPASNSYITAAIDSALELPGSNQDPGFVPGVKLGDRINLNNGDFGHPLCSDPQLGAIKSEAFIVVPVIKGSSFNQSQKVVTFVGLKISDVQKSTDPNVGDKITCTLVKPQVEGESGPIPTTGDHSLDDWITRMALGPIQLIE